MSYKSLWLFPFLVTPIIAATAFISAQEPPRPAATGGGLAERFKQLDRNGDGKVTREEAGQMPMFDQWDANKDGAVTLEEITAFYTNRRAAGKAANTRPAAPPTTTPPPAAAPTSPATPLTLAKPTLDLTIAVRDWEKACEFYGHILGLTALPEERGENQERVQPYRFGTTVLRLVSLGDAATAAPERARPQDARGYRHLTVSVTDIEKTKAMLRERGAPFLEGTDGRAFWITDPDGNRIQFVAHPANPSAR